MSIAKIFFWTIFFTTLGILAYQIYDNLPREPVSLTYEEQEQEQEIINYGDTPVFSENLRFAKNDIGYYIETSCSKEKTRRMKQALSIFENSFKHITFTQTNKGIADIEVGCSDEYIPQGDRLFTAGEGGPSRIISTNTFNIIEKGKISLYKEIEECEYPIVELHELLHVFGFDHTKNPESAMHNISNCEQRITPDMKRILNELYSIKALPDLVFRNLSVIQRGRYLDFNVTIINEGLTSTKEFRVSIVILGQEIEGFDFEKTEVGYGRTLKATNIRLPTRNIDTIKFIIDRYNTIEELSKENNVAQVRAT